MAERLSKTISSADVVGFAEITGTAIPSTCPSTSPRKPPRHTHRAWSLYGGPDLGRARHRRLPGPGAIYVSQTLNFRAPVKIGDTVEVEVVVAELEPERRRHACLARARSRGRSFSTERRW